MMLRLKEASKVYGFGRRRHVAVHPCSFECQSGEIVGVIGSNGAGKTTLLRMIAGETAVTSGSIQVDNLCSGTRASRRAVGYVADPPLFPGDLTGAEWLKYVCGHRASHPRERTAKLQWAIDIADLDGHIGRRISVYSSGMTRRLALATAAIMGSGVLALDEVLCGVDPLVGRSLREAMARLAASGRLLIIASHDLSSLERFATRVLVLWQGHMVCDVSLAQLASERVAELSLTGSGKSNRERLLNRFSGAIETQEGVSIPLTRGVTIEEALAVCRSERIPVASSRIRYRALEDILIAAASDFGESSRDPNGCTRDPGR